MRLTQLACDAHGCDARFPTNPTPRLDRRDARRDDWETHGEQDLCPAHGSRAVVVGHVRRLAAAGMTDARIATMIGRGRSFVWGLRQRHAIPGQSTGRPSSTRRPAPAATTQRAREVAAVCD